MAHITDDEKRAKAQKLLEANVVRTVARSDRRSRCYFCAGVFKRGEKKHVADEYRNRPHGHLDCVDKWSGQREARQLAKQARAEHTIELPPEPVAAPPAPITAREKALRVEELFWEVCEGTTDVSLRQMAEVQLELRELKAKLKTAGYIWADLTEKLEKTEAEKKRWSMIAFEYEIGLRDVIDVNRL